MKKTPHGLSESDFHHIAEYTEGYSGSDLSVLIRDACYEPLRKAQVAKFFYS